MHKSSYENMRRFADKYLKEYEAENLKIIDIGSQDVNGSYRNLFNKTGWKYTGADVVAGKNVDIVINDMYNWKEIKSNSYDIVISGQTLEHVEFFWITMSEIHRILKQNGMACIIAPSSGPEHKYPLDCWRFYPDGLSAVARYAGLKVVEVYNCKESNNSDGTVNIWKDSVLICKKP